MEAADGPPSRERSVAAFAQFTILLVELYELEQLDSIPLGPHATSEI